MSKKGIYYPIPDKYKYSFAVDNVKIKPIVSEEKDKYLALASAENLKKFLPKDLGEENIGLLAWAGNFCVVNKINLNDDCISTADGLYITDLLPYTYVDLEHDKGTILGVILNASFSEYGTDKPLTKEEVKNYTKPFNITVGGIIWRAVNSDFADAVENLGEENAKASINLSWEIAFSDYNLILIDKNKTNLEEGKIVSDAVEIERLEKKLKSYGGSGYEDGFKVARLIKNKPLPLGAGFVEHPAGQVGEITTASKESCGSCPECGEEMEMEDEMEDEDEVSCSKCGKKSMGKKWKSKDSEHYIEKCSCGEEIGGCMCSSANKKIIIIEKGCANCKKTQNSDSQSKTTDVKANTSIKNIDKPMIKNLKDITDENLKEAKAADISKVLDSEIDRISTEWKEKTEKASSELKASQEAQEKTQKDLAEANEKLAKVQEDLNKLIKAAEDKQAEEIFSARMNHFDSEYELDEKTRNAIANRIKTLDEEAYKKEKEDLEVLLAAKKKGFVPFTKKGEKEDSKEDKKEDKKEAKASEDKKEDVAAAVVDKAIDNGTKTVAAVAATTTPETTQSDKWAKAFSKENWELDSRFARK